MGEVTSSHGGPGDGEYAEVLSGLYAARRKGIDFGLDRIRTCLRSMGLEDGGAAHAVQIAGTNGKGSTARFLASILQKAGIRVGVFSSPHLLSLCERFTVDLKSISRRELVRAYRAVAPHAAGLTFFEQVTAMAAWLFRLRGVEVAIYEVGLGGRLDSTTAIATKVGVVTGIALDHCEYLGTELTNIADEKAGIFRHGGEAVIGLSAPAEIRQHLQSRARSAGARLSVVGDEHMRLVPDVLRMRGPHQRENAACAALAAIVLRNLGLEMPNTAIDAGLRCAEIPGRLQEVEAGLWVDGAHNVQASEALARAATAQAPWVMVVGLSAGKDIRGFLAPWTSLCTHLIATQGSNDRAREAEEIAAEAEEFANVEVQEDIAVALECARAIAAGRPILVTGSLLLLGEVLPLLGRGPADPLWVSDPGGSKFAHAPSEEYS